MSEYLISFVVSYFIGSIPTAYLVVKQTTNVDIRMIGSGNVGGRNALEVTGKKWIGIVVTLIDLLKGVASILIAVMFFQDPSTAVSAAMFGSVLGHCYPVWLKFHGGRGLATGAGSLLITSPLWVPIWLGLYFGAEKLTKNVHAASVIALVGLPLVMWFVSDQWMLKIIPHYFSPSEYVTSTSMVIAVCLSRHIEPIKEYFNEKQV